MISRGQMIEHLRKAVYCAFLASYCQGLELIARASQDEGWNIDLSECIRIWRAGCIIQSEFIADLLEPPLKENKSLTNIKLDGSVGRELQCSYSALKEIVSRGIAADHYLPALTATLEYVKYTPQAKCYPQSLWRRKWIILGRTHTISRAYEAKIPVR